jgi:hypothetical protein
MKSARAEIPRLLIAAPAVALFLAPFESSAHHHTSFRQNPFLFCTSPFPPVRQVVSSLHVSD